MELKEIQRNVLEIAKCFDRFCVERELDYVICGGTLIGAVRHKSFIPWDDDFDIGMMRADFEYFLNHWEDTHEIKLIKAGDVGYFKPGVPAKLYLASTRVAEIDELENGMSEFAIYGIFIDIFPMDIYPNNIFGRLANFCIGRMNLAKALSKFPLKKKSFFLRTIIKVFRLVPKTLIDMLIRKSVRLGKDLDEKKNNHFVGYGVEVPFSNLRMPFDKMWPPAREYLINDYTFKGPRDADFYLSQRFGDYMQIPPIEQRSQHIVKVKKVLGG